MNEFISFSSRLALSLHKKSLGGGCNDIVTSL